MIAEYEVATRKLLRRITDVAEPETFDLHPDGRHLYVSNEEDAAATVWDLETGEQTGFFETGEEPEGVQVDPGRQARLRRLRGGEPRARDRRRRRRR